ncbi:SRPBCC family protein [Salimicrobium halophilum]|uniref:Polyketide cyclase / dehydrase and lipid transport n=1 Tax=Salimicrobium halophilum TaxID=86666 RepID=A0A1G8TQD8_9BACI|nr:SRPBCC family protein [Salimicrobium halophilum]SDJ43749.1 Polyketide cyclase / dehydrase and lipid transport [Salimicrobium halophilum]
MITWKEEIMIEADIDTVWGLFKDEHIKRIMPQVEEHALIEKEEHEVGARHRQTYREGKRTETYIVTTTAYENTEEYRKKEVTFTVGRAFDIRTSYEFHKIGEEETKLVYEGTNEGVNILGKVMLKFATEKNNKKVVREFLERVKEEAEKEKTDVHS